MENSDAPVGSGAASLEVIRARAVDPIHLETMTQTQVFPGDETLDTVRWGANGGGYDFRTKPLGDDAMHNICRPVNERSLNAAANAAPANTDPHSSQHGTSRKRPTEVDHSDEGGSGGRTAKKINFRWTAQKHALLHKVANNRLNGTAADGIMASASLPSNLAQPVQQPVPTSNLFPSNTVRAMDNLNHIRQQEIVPRLYRLRYDCKNGGISMSPWPQDDDTDLLRRYQGENVVMENMTTTDMTHDIQNAETMDMPQDIQNAATKEMLGDCPPGQTSAVQPQGLGGEFFNRASTTFETAGSSAGGVVKDETLDWLTPDEFENLMNPSWS